MDRAFLCLSCDGFVHGANLIASQHQRSSRLSGFILPDEGAREASPQSYGAIPVRESTLPHGIEGGLTHSYPIWPSISESLRLGKGAPCRLTMIRAQFSGLESGFIGLSAIDQRGENGS
jgi:hypothetical protein